MDCSKEDVPEWKQKQQNLQKMLLDDSFQYTSKQSTREQKYQDVFRYKTILRRQNHNLKRQLQQTKEEILTKALGIYFEEIKELSEYNQLLRQKHRKIAEAKKPKIEPIQGLNSVLATPRSRRSIVNVYQPQNSQGPQTQRDHPQNDRIYGRKSLNCKNNQHQNYGRNSLKLSDVNKHSQLTEKKIGCRLIGGNNLSIFSQCNSRQNSLRGSIQDKSNSRVQQQQKTQNVFTQFVDLMLKQERDRNKATTDFIGQHSVKDNKFGKNSEQIIEISELEGQIRSTSDNIEQLEKMLKNYQHQIKQMHLNIQTVSVMTRDLGKVKQHFIAVKQKCRNVHHLRKQVEQRSSHLQNLRKKARKGEQNVFEAPQSIKILLKLFGVEQKQSLNNPVLAKKHIKNIVRGKLQKPTKRKVKVKQMLDNIREGRAKFKDLLKVYETRIKKIQKKIAGVKFQDCTH